PVLRVCVPLFATRRSSDLKGDFGYNARTDVYENLHAAGVVDPAKVTRVALENAASIAGMFLTTECVIVEKKEDKPEMPIGAPGIDRKSTRLNSSHVSISYA